MKVLAVGLRVVNNKIMQRHLLAPSPIIPTMITLVLNSRFHQVGGQSTRQTQLSLWQNNLNRENELFDHNTNGLQINTEYSYGISLLDGVNILTPFSAINYSESDLMSFDIGNRIKIGTDSSFVIKGTHEIGNNNINDNKFQLQGNS